MPRPYLSQNHSVTYGGTVPGLSPGRPNFKEDVKNYRKGLKLVKSALAATSFIN